MRTASADISAKIVLPDAVERGLRCPWLSRELTPPNLTLAATACRALRHNGAHGAHAGERRCTGARIAFWSGVALIARRAWRSSATSAGSSGAPTGSPSASSARSPRTLQKEWKPSRRTKLQPKYVPKGKASALIRIPRFGKKYVVPVLEGTSDDVLARGFGHFTEHRRPRARSATTRSPATGSPTASRCGGCRTCARATR